MSAGALDSNILFLFELSAPVLIYCGTPAVEEERHNLSPFMWSRKKYAYKIQCFAYAFFYAVVKVV